MGTQEQTATQTEETQGTSLEDIQQTIMDGKADSIQEDGTIKEQAKSEEPEEQAEPEESEEPEEAEEKAEPSEPSELEQLARSHGWTPKDEYDGDPEDWIDYKKFVENQWDISNSVKKKNDRLERQYNILMGHLKKIEGKISRDYEQKIADMKHKLEQEKEEAIREGDVDAVRNVDKKIDELNEQSDEDDVDDTETATSPVYDQWLEKNQWYGDNEEKTEDADAFADIYLKKHPLPNNQPLSDAYMAEMLKFIDKKMEWVHKPSQQQNTQKTTKKTTNRVPPVEGNKGNRSATRKKYTARDLDDDARQVAKDMARLLPDQFGSADEYAQALLEDSEE